MIIFVGDGMGTSHRELIRYATVGTTGQLAMDAMPYAGRSETSPLDPEAFVTDSVAGATAIATGVKTFNGAVGIDVDENPVQTVLERVEEEGIDEMAHQSNARLVIEAGRQLDEAVEVGKSFATDDADTLVIVAADHETGSLAIEDTNEIQSDPAYPNESGEGRTSEDGPFRVADSDKRFLVDWTTTNHTAEDVPVTAMGPGGNNLVGVYENTHIHDAMLSALFGSSASASATASATASASAPPSSSAGTQQVPDTGGLALGPPLLALAALFVGIAGFACVRRVVREP